jgi:hypothetical protein
MPLFELPPAPALAPTPAAAPSPLGLDPATAEAAGAPATPPEPVGDWAALSQQNSRALTSATRIRMPMDNVVTRY